MNSPAQASPSPKKKDVAGKLPVGVLEVCVHAATDLVGPYTKSTTHPRQLKYGTMNPSVKLELKELQHQHQKSAVPEAPSSAIRQLGADGASRRQVVSTDPAPNTQNAVYNPQYEKFEFLVYSADSMLVATVLNTKDAHPFRGMAEISLDEFATYHEQAVRERQKYVLTTDEAHLRWTVTGSVELSLAYRPIEKSKVSVTIENGRDVCCATNQMSNVVVSAGITSPDATSREQTKVVSNDGGNPLWGETMHFEYMNAVADSATLDIKLAETINARGHSATLVKGHPIGALSLPLKELLAAQKAYNQAVVDELMPEASILRQYHPMVNGDGESKGELYMLITVESPEIMVTRKRVAIEEAAAAEALMPKNLEEEDAFREDVKMKKAAPQGNALVNAMKLMVVLGATVGAVFGGHQLYTAVAEQAKNAKPAPKPKPAKKATEPAKKATEPATKSGPKATRGAGIWLGAGTLAAFAISQV